MKCMWKQGCPASKDLAREIRRRIRVLDQAGGAIGIRTEETVPDPVLWIKPVSARCLYFYFRRLHVAWHHDVVALPRGLPQACSRIAYFSEIVSKCLKGLVGAPGLEPGTR